jgi:mannose/cellobiose epimerase-like protein (N-acyl-D-glucosamine 2-epimerase family)
VEFAWLMLRAQEVLGEALDWDYFRRYLDHALAYGFDRERGGLFTLGMPGKQAHERRKVWWCQSEMVAALTYAMRGPFAGGDAQPLQATLDFLDRHMTDPVDGVYYSAVTEEGVVQQQGKANAWKGMYHDVRALVIFVSSFD